MLRILIICCLLSATLVGCNLSVKKDHVPWQLAAIEEDTTLYRLSAKFVKFEKRPVKYYDLYLKVEGDSIVRFYTMIFFDDENLALLKKDGDNVEIIYEIVQNPVTGITEKMVKRMRLILEEE